MVSFLLVLPFPGPECFMVSTMFLPSRTLPKTACPPSHHCGFGSAGEKPGTVCVGFSICCGQDARTCVPQKEILTKFLLLDGLATSVMMTCDITTLAQKLGNNPVKAGTFISKSFLPSAQSTDVLCCHWNLVRQQV